MRPLYNHILIKANPIKEQWKGIFFDTEWERNHHMLSSGTVLAVPEKLQYIPRKSLKYHQESVHITLEADVDLDLRVGDTVWFSYKAQLKNEEDGTFNKGDRELMVHYDRISVYERDGVIHACGGWVLYTPVLEEQIKSSIIELPDMVKKPKEVRDKFKILRLGQIVREYKHTGNADPPDELREGDIVYMTKKSRIPIQTEFQRDIFGDVMVCRGRRDWIQAIEVNENN